MFAAVTAFLLALVLLVPGNAQAAATTFVNAFITDPAKSSVVARVDLHGNLLVASRYQPVQVERVILLNSGDNTIIDVYPVPAGKRLLIQYVEGSVTYSTQDAKPYLALQTTVNGTQVDWPIDTPVPVPTFDGSFGAQGSSQVSIYADPAATVTALLAITRNGTGGVIGAIRISGILVDATAGVPPAGA